MQDRKLTSSSERQQQNGKSKNEQRKWKYSMYVNKIYKICWIREKNVCVSKNFHRLTASRSRSYMLLSICHGWNSIRNKNQVTEPKRFV